MEHIKISDYQKQPEVKQIQTIHNKMLKLLNTDMSEITVTFKHDTIALLIDLIEQNIAKLIPYDGKDNTQCPQCGTYNHRWFKHCKECGQRIAVTDGKNNIMYGV